MDNSSLTLSRNTLERVDMLMNRDFKTFNNIKSRSLLEKNHKNAIKIFTKKIFFYVILSGLAALVPSIETSVAATEVRVGETRTFIATAYYSPLPNQENYYQGSYEADKKLNGEWIQASDGTPVFVGMIAAPKNYAFGTKIALEGIGVVGVHDRGWSINAWENIDRIDIWMGYGDEWLKRTLAWWRREITGTIVDKKTPVSLDLQNIIKNAPQATQLAVMRLKALGYDTTKSFKEVITDFQMDYAIIPSRDDVAAGAYWPKTTAKLLEVYNNFLKTGNIATKQVINNNISDSSQKMSIQNAEYYAENTRTGFFGQYDSKVLNLQKFLVQMGYNTERQDGIMNLETLHSLRKYQYQKNIGQTGRVDLITQQQIVNDLLK